MKFVVLLTMLFASFSLANPVSNAEAGPIALPEADAAASAEDATGPIDAEGAVEARQASCRVTNRGGLNVMLHRSMPPLSPLSLPLASSSSQFHFMGKASSEVSQQTADVSNLSRVGAHAAPTP